MKDPSRRQSKAINPEVLPPYSGMSDKRVRHIPKWAIYSGIGASALIAVSSARTFFPIICLGLITGIALKKASKI